MMVHRMTTPDNSISSNTVASPRKLLSIVLPAYNEQEVLHLTYERFSAECPQFARYGLDYEIIIVNDGSRDRTPEILDAYAAKDPHFRAVHLTRNFGHQAAITAGLNVAKGDAVAIMDCDLQDPPEVLPPFIEQWLAGNQVVYAIRQKRKEWFGKRFAYWSFYRILAAVSDLKIPLDSGDFCLMDRSAVDLLNSLPERQRFVRGLRTWVGLKQVGVPYERAAREAGVPQYTFSKLVKLAMDGLISFSSVPLKFVTRIGDLQMLIDHAGIEGHVARLWVGPAEHLVLAVGVHVVENSRKPSSRSLLVMSTNTGKRTSSVRWMTSSCWRSCRPCASISASCP